jgi:hypothetical protein
MRYTRMAAFNIFGALLQKMSIDFYLSFSDTLAEVLRYMRILTKFVTVLLFGLQLATGQTVLSPDRTDQKDAPQSSERVLHYSLIPGGDVAVLQGGRTGNGPGLQARVLVTGTTGTVRSYSVQGLLPEPLVFFHARLVFLRQGMRGTETWALDTESGKQTQLDLQLTPVLAAGNQEKLVVVGYDSSNGNLNNGNVVLSVLGPALQPVNRYPVSSLTPPQLLRSLLSIDGSGRILLIDRFDSGYWPITIGSTASVGEKVLLSGAEVDLSRRVIKPAGRMREYFLLAHTTARNGNDLFFLSPYKAPEGYRMAEFDSQGRQQNSYRLQTGAPAGQPGFAWSNGTLSANQESIAIMSMDGVRRTYRRP